MSKKYELIDYNPETKLYRIRALRVFRTVNAGDIGGFVSGEHNLSHDGDCWIYGNARVYGNAQVFENARLFGNALVDENTHVCGDTLVYGNVATQDNAIRKRKIEAVRQYVDARLNREHMADFFGYDSPIVAEAIRYQLNEIRKILES